MNNAAFVIGPFPSGQYGVTDDGVRFFSVHPEVGRSKDAMIMAVRAARALNHGGTIEVFEADGFKIREPRVLRFEFPEEQ